MHFILSKLSLIFITLTVVLALPQPQQPANKPCPKGTGLNRHILGFCVTCNPGQAWTNVPYAEMCHYCQGNTYSTKAGASGCTSPCNYPYQVIPDPKAIPGSTLFGNIGCAIPSVVS